MRNNDEVGGVVDKRFNLNYRRLKMNRKSLIFPMLVLMIASAFAFAAPSYHFDVSDGEVRYVGSDNWEHIQSTESSFKGLSNPDFGNAHLKISGITDDGKRFSLNVMFSQLEVLKDNPSVLKVNMRGKGVYKRDGQEAILVNYDNVTYTLIKSSGEISLSAPGEGRFFVKNLQSSWI